VSAARSSEAEVQAGVRKVVSPSLKTIARTSAMPIGHHEIYTSELCDDSTVFAGAYKSIRIAFVT